MGLVNLQMQQVGLVRGGWVTLIQPGTGPVFQNCGYQFTHEVIAGKARAKIEGLASA